MGATLLTLAYWVAIGLWADNKVIGDRTNDPRAPWLALPVLGPFVSLAYSHDSWTGVLVADGVVQAAGACVAVVGELWRHPELVRDDVSSAPVALVPWMARSGGGFAVAGTF